MSFLPDLDRRVSDFVADHDIPAVAVAVSRGGEFAESAAGVLNANTGVTATTDSVFQVGSITKLFTAVLVMQLVDEGLVSLDATVRSYLPAFAVADDDASATVTVRQLLTHTGGFDGDVFEDTGRGDDALEKYVACLTSAKQIHAPGELFSYSNSGFCVLGEIVAKLRGGTWEENVRERVLTPLGLTQIALLPEEAILFRAAAGHHRVPDVERKRVFPIWKLPHSMAAAGANLTASPRELVRFGRMLMAGGVAEDGTRVCSAESVAAMLAPAVQTPNVFGTRWGLGAMVVDWSGASMAGHDGNTLGQDSFLRFLPEHDLVIAASGNGGDEWKILDYLIKPIVAELTGLAGPIRPTPPAEPSTIDVRSYLARYTGVMGDFVVEAADGGIEITTIPGELATSFGDRSETHRYVHLRGSHFIRHDPDHGFHPIVTFVSDGEYLHASRAFPRVVRAESAALGG